MDLNTYYTYSTLNQLTQVAMPRGAVTQTRTFVYDAATQRLKSATNPENGTVQFAHHADGTLAHKIDAKGQKIVYGYDSLQRPVSTTVYPDGVNVDPCQTVTTHYDTNPDDQGKGDPPFTENAANRVAMVAWGGAACAGGYTYHEAFRYSSAGLVLKQRLTVWKGTPQRELEAAYTYNSEGQLTSLTYPSSHTYSGGSWQVVPGRMYVYGFDAMGRPNRMYTIEDRQYDLVKDVVYGPASNLTQVRYLETKGASAPEDVYYLHTNTYNTLQQLTRMTTVREGGGGGTIMDMEYRFSAAQNNGRITQQKDWVSGEEVSYQYDSLQRLISAVTTGPEWGQSFSYDGFGNLLAKSVTKGSAPALSVNVDGATNRITTAGFGYDANGNMTAIPGVTGVAYDGRNRLTAAGGDQYSYRPDNKRLWKTLPGGTEEVYFYSIRGERLGTYEPAVDGTALYLKFKSTELYFAGSLIRSQGQAVVLDRLGSVRSFGGTAMRYFPYGEEQTSTPNGRPKFGTYFRDESTGLDYANQRYYGSGMGRFLTTDPCDASSDADAPGTWNRFGYGNSDPTNFVDPSGLVAVDICAYAGCLMAPPAADGSNWNGSTGGAGGIVWIGNVTPPALVTIPGTGLPGSILGPVAPHAPVAPPSVMNPLPAPVPTTGSALRPMPAAPPVSLGSPLQATIPFPGIRPPLPLPWPVQVIVAAIPIIQIIAKQIEDRWDRSREPECDRQKAADDAVCRRVAERDPGAGSRCWASSNERWAACMKGRELPPLVTW